MDAKLTIRLNENVIHRAKNYARNYNTSLSKMIESYLNAITKQESKDIEITPFVKSLSGIIQLPDNYDYKQEYSEYLINKYK